MEAQRNRNGDFRHLEGTVKEHHERQRELHAEKLHRRQAGVPSSESNVLYQVIRGRVSHHALKQIQRQETIARNELAAERGPTVCSGN